jgi:hypothetical protein
LRSLRFDMGKLTREFEYRLGGTVRGNDIRVGLSAGGLRSGYTTAAIMRAASAGADCETFRIQLVMAVLCTFAKTTGVGWRRRTLKRHGAEGPDQRE